MKVERVAQQPLGKQKGRSPAALGKNSALPAEGPIRRCADIRYFKLAHALSSGQLSFSLMLHLTDAGRGEGVARRAPFGEPGAPYPL